MILTAMDAHETPTNYQTVEDAIIPLVQRAAANGQFSCSIPSYLLDQKVRERLIELGYVVGPRGDFDTRIIW